MERTQKIEEALSIVWEEREKGLCGKECLREKIRTKLEEDMLDELIDTGYLHLKGNIVDLSRTGEVIAKDVIRRERLAERLLADVLELDKESMDSSACAIEHILSSEVEEGICTLLGHPKECPHGLPIPQGDCCMKAIDQLESIVVPVTKLEPGDIGRVVYVLTKQHPQLHKLLSFGISPGAIISVHQVFPVFVVQVEETQVALEKEIAAQVFVKRLKK